MNQARKARLISEQKLIDALARDIDLRHSNYPNADPVTVYVDFDRTHEYTEVDPRRLPEWRDLGEYIKFHILGFAAWKLGGMSFTIRIRPDLQTKWKRHKKDPMDRIQRLVAKGIKDSGLTDLAFCYVVEGRTRRGSFTKLHLHGFFVSHDPMVGTRFKMAMEPLATHPAGKIAAGYAQHSGHPIDIVPYYDHNEGMLANRGRWVEYISKAAMQWDERLPGRRIYMSLEGTQTACALWGLIKSEA